MRIPTAVREQVEEQFGPVSSVTPVGGGCINPSVRLTLPDRTAFLKFNPESPPALFHVEARGLQALRDAAAGLRIPEVLAVGEGDGIGWLLLEWLAPAPRGPNFGERLGRGLAALHRAGADAETEWGWPEDGWIGPLPQENTRMADWPEFWRSRRLEPQLRHARDAGRMPGRAAEWKHLFAHLPELLAPAEQDGPSLLHGDLWSGNVLPAEPQEGGAGEPALVDPATYRGHREVDLAMSELFGGFDASFYAAYRETWPLEPGYRELRRSVYQLFYLLVHVNVFGGSYIPSTERTLRSVLAC